MFGWFKPRCPLDLQEKVWTEYRTMWLVEKVGIDRVRRARIVLPTPEFFPDPFQPSQAHAKTVFRRLCGYVGVPAERVRLAFHSERADAFGAGRYQAGDPPMVSICDTMLEEEEPLIATMAHELAHEILLGGGLMTGDEPDHEHVTDLLTAVLGVGVFAANSAVRDRTDRVGDWEFWSIRKLGYLPARMLGYAFALTAWLRDDLDPEWTWALRSDARHAMTAGLKYLRSGGDCLIDRSSVGRSGAEPSDAQVVARLDSASETTALAALWSLRSRPALFAAAVPCLAKRLVAEHMAFRSAALDVVEQFPTLPDLLVRPLAALLGDASLELRYRAALAASRFELPHDLDCGNGRHVVGNLTEICRSLETKIECPIMMRALAAYGPRAASAAPLVFRRLERAVDRIEPEIDSCFEALESMGIDVEAMSREKHGVGNPVRHSALVAELQRFRKERRSGEKERRRGRNSDRD